MATEHGSAGGGVPLRVSAGTAAAIGLSRAHPADPSTTAYIMCGEGCAFACAFCPQSRGSRSGPGMLSRVLWPRCEMEALVAGVAGAYGEGRLQRACVQVVHGRGAWRAAAAVAAALAARYDIPVSLSTVPAAPARVAEAFSWGVQRVGLPIDAATAAIHQEVKGRPLAAAEVRVARAAEMFPGRVSTHLMVGLGETEEEAVRFVQRWHDRGVTVGLFAFTPVRGTALERRPPPPLDSYRRVQAAAHLVRAGLARCEDMRFAAPGRLLDLGVDPALARSALGDGAAFQTSGCPGCNRPYYNERPGGPLFNYPRPLTAAEAGRELDQLLDRLRPGRAGQPGGRDQ